MMTLILSPLRAREPRPLLHPASSQAWTTCHTQLSVHHRHQRLNNSSIACIMRLTITRLHYQPHTKPTANSTPGRRNSSRTSSTQSTTQHRLCLIRSRFHNSKCKCCQTDYPSNSKRIRDISSTALVPNLNSTPCRSAAVALSSETAH